MRAVVQRVTEASVTSEGVTLSQIQHGLVILLGIAPDDDQDDQQWLANKIAHLRIFPDDQGAMNCSVGDVNGEIVVVSQFTLFASTKKGTRPGFSKAAGPELASGAYDAFCNYLSKVTGKPVGRGRFAADMKVRLVNDGPVTICIDTKNRE